MRTYGGRLHIRGLHAAISPCLAALLLGHLQAQQQTARKTPSNKGAEMKTNKPRIYKHAGYWWACYSAGCGVVGYGLTPKAAYDDFQLARAVLQASIEVQGNGPKDN